MKLEKSASAEKTPASTPYHPPPISRRATRKAITQASSPPARATTSQRYGAAWSPKTENTVVKMIGSGFHDGPPVVTRSRCAISRPHRIQAHGS